MQGLREIAVVVGGQYAKLAVCILKDKCMQTE